MKHKKIIEARKPIEEKLTELIEEHEKLINKEESFDKRDKSKIMWRDQLWGRINLIYGEIKALQWVLLFVLNKKIKKSSN